MPAIDDHGFTLSESHAILTYLANKHGWSDLYPSDPSARALVDRYLHWHHRNTREITIRLFAPVVRPDLKIPDYVVKEGKAVVTAVMSSIERFLATTGAYLCGSTPTIADIACYCEVAQCTDDFCGLWDFSDLPNIRRWLEAMKQLPGHDKAHEGLRAFAPNIREAVKARGDAKL